MSINVDKVKDICGIDNPELEDFLIFCENNIIDKLLDKCNLDTVPGRLNTLIQEFLIEQYSINKNGIGEGITEASSASDNGQNVTFKTIGGVNDMSRNSEEFLSKNTETWIQYRRLRW